MDFDFTTETITPDSTNILTIGGTGGIEIPIGTTADRPVSPERGTTRYNIDLEQFEVYAGDPAGWTTFGVDVLTTKGDLLSRTTTSNARLPVGDNGQFLAVNDSTSTGLEWVQNPVLTYAQLVDDPTGFPNRTDSEILFNNNTRVFTIQPTSASFSVYVHGTEFVKTGPDTVTIPDVTDEYYIFYDTSGTLQISTGFFNLQNCAPVSLVYWNATQSKQVLFGEERHGLAMDWATHRYLHTTQGAKYVSGLYLGNYSTTGTGAINADAQVSISDGVIADEDIYISISHSNSPTLPFQQVLSPIARIPVIYRQSTTGEWFRDSATDVPLKMGTALPVWNEFTGSNWQTTEVASGSFIAMWVIATNDVNEPVLALLGQSVDTSLSEARINNDYTTLDVSGLPFLEVRPLFKVIYEVDSSFANDYKAAVRDVVSIQLSATIQLTQAIASGTVTSVNVSGGSTGLTTLGGPITLSGTIELDGTLVTAHGGTGLTSVGSSNQLLGVNAGATGLEYKSVIAGSGISVTPTAGALTISATNIGTVTSVSASGGTTGLSFTGSPITTSGTLTLSGTLNAVNGGTGFDSYVVGDILYAGTTTTLAKRAAVASGNALLSAGVGIAPTWGKVGLTTHISGILPIANGGTGLSTTPTNGQIDIGNGTGFTRSTITSGTGISITNGAGSITIAAVNNGTVTSVAATQPAAGLTITGSPITGSGTLTFALANDLAAVEGITTSGLAVRSGTDTWTTRSITQPAAGITVSNPAGIAGNPTIALANDLAAVEALAGTGFAVRTGTDTWANRSLVAGTGITVSNPTGAAGNSTISVDSTVLTTSTGYTTINGTTNQITATGAAPTRTLSLSDNTILPGTGAVTVPIGTTAQRPVSPVNGMIRYNTTLGAYEVYSDGTWSQFPSPVVGWYGLVSAVSGNTTIPSDGSTPLITEGTQIWSQTITPSNTAKKYRINFFPNVDVGTNNRYVTLALFRGNTCIAVSSVNCASASRVYSLVFQFIDEPATTTTFTYTMRAGIGGGTGTWFVNNSNINSHRYNGLLANHWNIAEFE